MKISAKTRYGAAAMICLARNHRTTERTSVVSMSEKLQVSKIYLEQVFSLLKRARLVVSVKGSQGGYYLSRPPNEITVYDIFAALEMSLLEKTSDTVSGSEKSIETAMRTLIFDRLDETVAALLSDITIADLTSEAECIPSDGYMYYL